MPREVPCVICVRVTPQVREYLRTYAAALAVPISALIREAVDDLIASLAEEQEEG